MKKAISFVLCLCMALSMSVFAVSAAEVSEIKDGAVIEFEQFAGEANKDLYVFENLNAGKRAYGVAISSTVADPEGEVLSGGAVLSLSERTGATSLIFTIPVSVTESGWYDVEWYGTDGGAAATYLSNYTVSLGESSFTVAGNTTDYFKPATGAVVGDGTDLAYYPIKRFQTRLYLAETVENIVIKANPNTNGTSSGTGIKMAIDCMKFTKYPPVASQSKSLVLEMENYIPDIRYTFVEGKTNSANVVKEEKASGGAVMNMSEKSNIKAMEFDIPVEIKENGWYVLNLVANNSNVGDTSVLRIKNGEDEWVNNWRDSGYAGKTLLYFGAGSSYVHYGVYDHETVKYLTAGEYTLTASAVGITNNPNATKFIADCLKISPAKTDIPAEGKRLELENYKSYMSPRQSGVKTNEKGETFLTDLGGVTTGFEALLNFEETGYYDVTFHGSPYKNNGLSKVNFYLGDDLMMDNNNAKYGVDEGYLFSEYLPAWLFKKEKVYIEAGTITLKMEVLTRDPNSTTVQCAHASDYLEFTKSQLPEISDKEETTLEMEDYLPFIRYTYGANGTNSAAIKNTDKASGGAILDMSERGHITAVDFDIPVTVKESGWYKVNLVANNSGKDYTSVLNIKLGDKNIVNNWDNSGYAGKELLYFGTDADGTYKYYGMYNHETLCYLEAGENYLKASATAITTNPNATKFVADCLKFAPLKMDLPADGVLQIEDVRAYFQPWLPGIVTLAGDDPVTAIWTYSGVDVKATLPIVFPESGYYNVEFLGTPYNNNGLSKINITFDDDLLMNNDEKKGGEALGYNYKDFLPAYKFEKKFVYIEEGVHNVSIEAIMRNPDPTKNNECAFGMDYIAFNAVTDEAVVDTAGRTVNVTACYDAPVSGEIVVASYVGDEMVGFDSFTETDISFLDVAVSYSGSVAPDTVKVFVWKDLTDVIPLAKGKAIATK